MILPLLAARPLEPAAHSFPKLDAAALHYSRRIRRNLSFIEHDQMVQTLAANELILAVAFVSGFSDRLLLRAIDSLSK